MNDWIRNLIFTVYDYDYRLLAISAMAFIFICGIVAYVIFEALINAVVGR